MSHQTTSGSDPNTRLEAGHPPGEPSVNPSSEPSTEIPSSDFAALEDDATGPFQASPANAVPSSSMANERRQELLHRLRRAEGQVRGLQKLLEEGADCTKIAQQLLAVRHALDSTYVRLNLSVAEHELSAGGQHSSEQLGEVLGRLQNRLGKGR